MLNFICNKIQNNGFVIAEVRKLVEQYSNASREMKNQMESKYGKKHLETLVNNTKAESWIKDNTKTCPKCEVAIEVRRKYNYY